MLWVAFSRRMCCSRVCSASTKPRRPSTSVVSPAIRPGIRRRCSSVAAKKPNEGPPKSSRLPSGWPSPSATSTPHSPGGRRTPSVIGSTEATQSAPASWAASASASRSSIAPRKFGFWTKTAAVLVVERLGELAGVGEPALEPDLDHLGVEAARVGLERRPGVRVQAARDDEAPAPLARPERQVGGRGDRRRALVERRVGDRQAGELGDRGLELEHHLQPALRDLGLIGRVRGEELRARDDRLDQRRGRSGRTSRRR